MILIRANKSGTSSSKCTNVLLDFNVYNVDYKPTCAELASKFLQYVKRICR